jgi:tetratricopeptide (TPR) repeat protein
LNHLADAYQWAGRFPEAIALRQRLMESRWAAFGPEHPDTLAGLNGLAQAYQAAGQLDASSRLFEVLLEKYRTLNGPAHPTTLGTMKGLGVNYLEADRLVHAMDLYERYLKLSEATYGPKHETTAWALRCFAYACMRAGALDKADRLLEDALEIECKGDDSVARRIGKANTLGWQAQLRLLQRRYAEAEKLVREALATFERLSPNNQRRFYWMSVLGEALSGQGRQAEAERHLLDGYRGMKQQEAVMPAIDRRRLSTACERLVRFYELTHQPEKALEWQGILSASPPPG